MDFYGNVDKYARKLINIIARPECEKVFQNRYLMLTIFSYFESGWNAGISYAKQKFCLYHDIFGCLVKVNQVTSRITNPYHDEGVCQEAKTNSYYVGPVVKYKNSFEKK